MLEASSDSLRSSVSSPGMPNTYSTPSASRHSTNRSDALRSLISATSYQYLCRATLNPLLRLGCLTLAALALLATPAFAAKARFTIRGAGFGHGVGMSQYGAYGFAQHGSTYDAILRHYYRDTALGTTDPGAPVRVLIQSTGTARFSGASRAGTRGLNPDRTYQVRRRGSAQVDLLSSAGRRIASFAAPLQVTGPGNVVALGGVGSYRGMLEFRPDTFGGVNVINAVALEDYVAGRGRARVAVVVAG